MLMLAAEYSERVQRGKWGSYYRACLFAQKKKLDAAAFFDIAAKWAKSADAAKWLALQRGAEPEGELEDEEEEEPIDVELKEEEKKQRKKKKEKRKRKKKDEPSSPDETSSSGPGPGGDVSSSSSSEPGAAPPPRVDDDYLRSGNAFWLSQAVGITLPVCRGCRENVERCSWRRMDSDLESQHFWRQNKASWHLKPDCIKAYFAKRTTWGRQTPAFSDAQILLIKGGARPDGERSVDGNLFKAAVPS